METEKWQRERNEDCQERHELSVGRLVEMEEEENVPEQFLPYFHFVASFMVELENVRSEVESGEWDRLTWQEKEKINQALYQDILPEHYEKSFANPTYAVSELGEDYGSFLCCLYAELRSGIPYVFENREDGLTILNELLIEIYDRFEEELPPYDALKDIFYWYASDYCDVIYADRLEEQLLPERTNFATRIIMEADLSDPGYLYDFGEYITDNERQTAAFLNQLPGETLQRMADVFTEGYRVGFIQTGKDLSKKSTVNIRYCLGFESVVRLAISNFEKMGLKPVIYRAATSVITRKEQNKVGYFGAAANKQYEYDHRSDQALFLDKKYLERKLEVAESVYESDKAQAAGLAGPAVMEVFGEKPFSPKSTVEAKDYTDEQREWLLSYDSRSDQLTNQYIRGDERSFTIISWPIPEVGEPYDEIFQSVIQINTLDANVFEEVQQTLIDALDQGEYVHVLGKGENQTDLWIHLHPLTDPASQTIFENCVADVNIPVGEVFTSPVLTGTNGVLNVSKVYLEGLEYDDLKLTFKDGRVSDYTCRNFEKEEENRSYLSDTLLKHHDTLPMGEFAIGTNTTAYVAGKKYQIEDKLPILIAEKTGPHFALGDTCYSWSEDIAVFNPNGKEIIARDNEISLLRKENPEKAYFQCHTDITIPYEELAEISVVRKDKTTITLLKDGRFALAGTEVLNQPLEEYENSRLH